MAAGKPIVSDQDYQGRARLIRPVLAQPTTPPAAADAVVGEFWLDPITGLLTFRDKTQIVEPTDRGAHHGTQLAETISDLAPTIRAVPLNELAPATALVNVGGQRIGGVADAENPDEAVNAGMLQLAMSEFEGGLTEVSDTLMQLRGALAVHMPVLVSSTNTELELTGTPVIDGVQTTGNINESVLVISHAIPENQGIWYTCPPGVDHGAGEGVWTRGPNGNDVPDQIISGTHVWVTSGTARGASWYTYDNGRYQDPDTLEQPGTWTRLIDETDSITALAVPAAQVSLGGQRLTNLATSQAATDAVTQAELHAVRDNAAASDTRTLDQIPTAAAAVALGGQKLTDVADGTAPQDVIVRHQLDDEATALRAELSTASAAAAAATATSDARTLDQIPTAAATVNLGGQELQSVADPTQDGSAVNRAFMYAHTTTIAGRTLDQVPPPVAPVDLASQRITNLALPEADGDAVSRAWVRGFMQGMDTKPNARVVTDQAYAHSGLPVIAGVQVADGDRILDRSGTVEQQGIWIARPGAWELAPDSADGMLTSGATVTVEEGTGRGVWRLVTPDPISVGNTAQVWERLPTFDYTASAGVKLVGTDFQADYTVVARKYTALFGDAVATQFVIPHGLGHAITLAVWEVATGELLDARVVNDPATGMFATVYVSVPPGVNAFRFVATG